VKLHINLSISTLLLAIAIALLGSLVAGAFGAWRAARLTPASAFRSVE
jgi:ABC-type lipoprotein release transport system permease subunit